MNHQCIEKKAETALSRESVTDSLSAIEARELLKSLLDERIAAHLLDEQDGLILSLRLGLENGRCYTLDETADLVHKSPEAIRRRQYLALKRAIKDLRFFKLFRDYARLVSLPRGVTYYLYRYSDYTGTF